jgi:two-component system nitrate/nitrite response regulator NarL
MILDITMPLMSGLEASARMRKLGLGFPILIFTTHDADRLAQEVRRAKAQGYVLKSQAARDLVLAIESLIAGGTFFGTFPDSKPGKNDKPSPGLLLRRICVLTA